MLDTSITGIMDKSRNGVDKRKGLKVILKRFREHTKNPELFLTAQKAKTEKIKNLVKLLYDHGQQYEPEQALAQKPYLEELVVDDMDEEQIWQQLELKNEQLLDNNLQQTSKLLSASEKRLQLAFSTGLDSDVDAEENISENDNEVEECDQDIAGAKKKSKKKVKTKKSIVDDDFFKLEDMARFLDEEDAREMRRQDGKPDKNPLIEIDYFSAETGKDEDSDGENMKYSDFFDDDDESDDLSGDESDGDDNNNLRESQDENTEDDASIEDMKDENADEDSEDEVERNRRLRFELYNNSGEFIPGSSSKNSDLSKEKLVEDDNEEESMEKEDGPKSSFEMRQEKLKQKIKRMEDQLLQDKPWQLKGEISADTRPQNSLLEEVLEFESTTRPAPIITEETTMRLEDIIKQRIKNKAFDDVERKIRPPDNPQEYRKQLVIDSEKSKESLAQIYEKDYLKQLKNANPDAEDVEEEEPKEHKEIRIKMKTLLAQLDALSNFHYTPRPAVPDLKIITNTPAINMEEVAPVATSNATLLAPEEVHNRPKGDVMSKAERTKTDKNRERRLKKRFQKEKFQRQAAKEQKLLAKGVAPKGKDLQEKLLKKVSQAKNVSTMAETKGVAKSSAAFFSQLQDEVTSQIKSKTNLNKKSKKSNTSEGLQATHIKL